MNDSSDKDDSASDSDGASDDQGSEPGPVATTTSLPSSAVLPLSLGITAVVAGVVYYAFQIEQAGTWGMLLAMFGVNLPFAALSVFLLRKDERIVAELRPKGGDLSFGAAIAAVMYFAAMAGRQLFMGGQTPRSWWIARVYLQLGDTSNNRMLYVGACVLVIAALEELVWRGLVMRHLASQMGKMRAWLVSSFLYGLAHGATLFLLAHPLAGPNPLVIVAALGGGLVWGHLYNRTGRLVPSLFAHALFTWAIVDFPLWRP